MTPPRTRHTRRKPIGLPTRLLTAHLLVGAVALLTISLIAFALGPPLFRTHLRQAMPDAPPAVAPHAQEAFTTATGVAVAIGAGAALLAAIASSALITRRLTRPVIALSAAAARLATGDHAARMPPTGLGPQLDALTDAFNAMAAALQETERTRRRLLADLAHELRTPLATLDAHIEALADGVRTPDEESWQIMHAQTRRLRRLADDLTLVSRAEEHALPVHCRRIDPAGLVTAAIDGAQPAYEARAVRLVARLGPELPPTTADPDRLTQALSNLLDNALRHTPPGGTVTVAADDTAHATRITVTDTGEGIAAEHLPHVFERFYRADPARTHAASGGSGIGLTISRALIEAHHGTLTAASAGPGTGARFTIELPHEGSKELR